jgi:hypothetical protein
MVAFVDDCNGQTNRFQDDAGSTATVTQLVQQTQHNAQVWSDLFAESGGKLELSKCSYHILQWQFSAQGAPVVIPNQVNFQDALTVRDRQNQSEHRLQILSPYTAHKTLGH